MKAAFCPHLLGITLPEGLKKLNTNIFFNCPSLEKIVIKDFVPYYKHLFGNDAELVVRDINNCPIR